MWYLIRYFTLFIAIDIILARLHIPTTAFWEYIIVMTLVFLIDVNARESKIK